MLELSNVHAHYGLSHVLQGISISVKAGEVVGLFGRNGVGKTTVMKTIAGWLAPSEGRIAFEGTDIGGSASDIICRQGIGFVPEDRRIFPGLTVEENLMLGFMQVPRRSGTESRRRLDEIYTRFPRLGERRTQLGTTLSGGEQQMLAMARVLVGQPKLLLIDEPTEGLAPKIVDEIFELMEGLRRDGIPIVLVEQNVRRAIELTTRFYAIERGQVVATGRADVATDREALFERIAV
ncbi:ABC transporter ATP-binding protein [Variovorax ginsengisoli]|uniref:ABC transporter ATP-binding protein n=1 Tax=Variovorax ginsengisoli TaxID=363844 RepID=A0ABT8SE63_9BURK|nr:ABC transporter ATP-binding protein [Variovorax ginsengisoli]MDO1537221.1 ABC transporter ATP-binding protein [Variovorax ginsengisoli]